MGVVDVRYVYDDLLTMPDDGHRYELLAGDLMVSPSAMPRHQHIAKNLIVALSRWEAARLGRVYSAPLDVVLDRHTVFEPDVLFIHAEHLAIVTESPVKGPPDLVVEVLSDSTRRVDLGRKLRAYGRYGVNEYWAVDPAEGTVQVFRRDGPAFVATDRLSAGDAITYLGCRSPSPTSCRSDRKAAVVHDLIYGSRPLGP